MNSTGKMSKENKKQEVFNTSSRAIAALMDNNIIYLNSSEGSKMATSALEDTQKTLQTFSRFVDALVAPEEVEREIANPDKEVKKGPLEEKNSSTYMSIDEESSGLRGVNKLILLE